MRLKWIFRQKTGQLFAEGILEEAKTCPFYFACYFEY